MASTAGTKCRQPKRLPDADAEALRQVLYGPQAPSAVPDESIVNIEFYFDVPTTEMLWKVTGGS